MQEVRANYHRPLFLSPPALKPSRRSDQRPGGSLVYTMPTERTLLPLPTPPSLMSDSELRQRQPSPAISPLASPRKHKSPSGLPPLNSPRPATPTTTRGFILLASLALSITLLLYLRGFHSSSPSSYILCSPPGEQQIYTVDHDDSKVECMVVHGDFIIDTGARGMSHEPITPFKTLVHGSFPPSRPHRPVFIVQFDPHHAWCNCRSGTHR